MSNTNYKPGNPEYDFWNDKNLYPDLRNDYDEPQHQSKQPATSEDTQVSGISIFITIFVWLFILAPFAFFFTWEDWIVQILFWGGVVIILIKFALWFYSVYQEEKKKKS